jgi:hypothetical protein
MTRKREEVFHTSKSSTYVSMDQDKLVGDSYGSGTIRGFEVQDTVALDRLILPEMTFCAVTDLHLQNYGDLAFSGLVGLSYARISQQREISIVNEIQQKNYIANLVFAFYLSAEHGDTESEFTLGYINPQRF